MGTIKHTIGKLLKRVGIKMKLIGCSIQKLHYLKKQNKIEVISPLDVFIKAHARSD